MLAVINSNARAEY